MKRISENILGWLIIALLAGSIYSVKHGWKKDQERMSPKDSIWSICNPYIYKIFKDAKTIAFDKEGHKIVLDSNLTIIGKILISNDNKQRIYGYAGEIPVLIGIDNKEKIIGVTVLKNRETPNFMKRVINYGLLKKWDNLPVYIARDTKPDALTGATMTCRAITLGVTRTLSWYTKVQEKKEKTDWGKIFKFLSLSLVMVLALLNYFYPGYFKKTRLILHISTIVIVGFWTGNFISAALLYGWLLNGIHLSAEFILIIFILSIALPLFTRKSFYCNFICPYGACQEIAGLIPIKKLSISSRIARILHIIRPILFLMLILILISFDLIPDLAMIEPFQAFLIKSGTIFIFYFACLFILASIIIHRPWCNYFCITGQFFEIIRKPMFDLLSIQSIKRNLILIILFVIILIISLIFSILGLNLM